MDDMSKEEAVSTFQTITGADEKTAEHVLEAHAWDLNRGVNFFMESSNIVPAVAASRNVDEQNGFPAHEEDEMAYDQTGMRSNGAQGHLQATRRRSRWSSPEPRPISDDDDDDDEYQPHHSPKTRHVPYQVLEDDEQSRRNAREGAAKNEPIDLDDDDDEDFVVQDPTEAAPSQNRRSRRGQLSSHRIDDTDEEVDRNGSVPGADPQRHITRAIGSTEFPFGLPFLPPITRGRTAANSNGFDHSVLPDGIDVEEARMLEAAMMGIPYEGRVPDFREAQRNNIPEDPAVIQQRLLREEQDQAYQDSLLADIEKKSAAEALERAEEDKRLEIEHEKQAAEQAQRDYERDIEEKVLNLPEEPGANTEGAVTIMIRTSKGARYGRRFLASNSVEDLFCFVDVSAAPDTKPGTYQLVTQFPRKVLKDNMRMSLAEAGLTQKQEALFLETTA